ncbi:MAG TPA: hypothetical protein VNT52_16530 [Acidimicrobiales bacterium]|nr:hypothetical protein [Acidimicrobiales bacterium]
MPHPVGGGHRAAMVRTGLCDLVQLRSSTAGPIVRLHMRRRAGHLAAVSGR